GEGVLFDIAPAEVALPAVAEVDPDDIDERSIIDALDELPPPGWLSADGHRRLSRLSGELRSLRSRLAPPLPGLVSDGIRSTGLDVEVLARGDATATRANLHRIIEVAAEFAAGVEEPSGP